MDLPRQPFPQHVNLHKATPGNAPGNESSIFTGISIWPDGWLSSFRAASGWGKEVGRCENENLSGAGKSTLPDPIPDPKRVEMGLFWRKSKRWKFKWVYISWFGWKLILGKFRLEVLRFIVMESISCLVFIIMGLKSGINPWFPAGLGGKSPQPAVRHRKRNPKMMNAQKSDTWSC